MMGSIFLLLTQVIGTVCALIVAWRAICVVSHLNFKKRNEHYIHWLLFGLSYCLLAVCALGSMFQIWRDCLDLRDVLWCVASAGLIVWDRRKRKRWAYEETRA